MTAEDLRKSILQQAIQGKLVPQDPTVEPASILLARIREEKARLIKEKKIKKDKNESLIYRGDDNSYYEKFGDGTVKCIDEEIPFDIPQGWEWANIGSLFFIQTGASFKKEQAYTTPKGIRILRGGNILPNYYTFKDDDLFVAPSLVSDSILLQKNDLITPAVTSIDNIGKMARITESYTNVSAGGFVFIMRGYLQNDVLSEYLCAAIQSPYVTNSIKAITKKSGSAFYNIGKERLVSIFVPIPPIEEQQRIVDRINLLLTHVDKYKAAYSLITSLENSILPSIKKSILQYAIQGKLVPQNPGDKPANELLKRIEEEKARLVKAGKIKRDKNASVIFKGEDNKYYEKLGSKVSDISDEIPYELPANWEFVRLSRLCWLDDGVKVSGEKLPYLDAKHHRGKGEVTYLTSGKVVTPPCKVILVDGENSGEIFDVSERGYLGSTFKVLQISPCISEEWLHILLMNYRNLFKNSKVGAAIPHLNKNLFRNLIVGIPPLSEQEEIATRIRQVYKSIEG